MATSTKEQPKSSTGKESTPGTSSKEQTTQSTTTKTSSVSNGGIKKATTNGSGLSLTKSEIRLAVDNPFDQPLSFYPTSFQFKDILDLKRPNTRLDPVAAEALKVIKEEYKEVNPSND